ncbi:hypothetical protein ACQEU6_24500 [Spirillospora sp. CA-108201]
MSPRDQAVQPTRLAEEVVRRRRGSTADLGAYWYQATGSRDDFAGKLRAELAEHPVIVLVVRSNGFTVANSLLNDFVALLHQNRTACEEKLQAADGRVDVILIARSELAVPQISSPVRLPEWWPGAGREIMVEIEDLTWKVEASLDSAENAIPEICERLYYAEEELLRRLCEVHAVDPAGLALLVRVLDRERERQCADDFLSAARAARAKVRSAQAFRPSMRERESLVARLWTALRQTRPDELHQVADGLCAALALPDEFVPERRESIIGLLVGPTSRRPPEGRRFALNVLYTVGAACQFVTASKHADVHPSYPLPLTRSLSYDLRRSLDSIIETLDAPAF